MSRDLCSVCLRQIPTYEDSKRWDDLQFVAETNLCWRALDEKCLARLAKRVGALEVLTNRIEPCTVCNGTGADPLWCGPLGQRRGCGFCNGVGISMRPFCDCGKRAEKEGGK